MATAPEGALNTSALTWRAAAMVGLLSFGCIARSALAAEIRAAEPLSPRDGSSAGSVEQPAPPVAQAPAPAGGPTTTWIVRDWTRVEDWSFFEPPPGGGNSNYTYIANRLQFGLRLTASRYEVTALGQYVQFGGLPSDAVGPGPLGLGAVYFAHAGRADSRQVYPRFLNLRVKNLLPGLSVQAGRMGYTSGAESPSGDARIEFIKRQRVDSRLVGEFEWALFQRSFDGVRLDFSRPKWNATGFVARPTQGGFEDAAGRQMTDLAVTGATAFLKPGTLLSRTDVQLFTFRYDDHRAVTARPDNTGRTATAADVEVNTFGASLVAASPSRGTLQWDGLLWFAGQTGHWYELAHRGYSVAAEGGVQWPTAWRPWLRAGYLRASGDDDPADRYHRTFFQMLPTVRRYSQTATYSQMNNQDVFAQAFLRPTERVSVRVDVHEVGLVSANDRWYSGSGATQNAGSLFGYTTRPSNRSTSLGTVVEGSVDYAIRAHWSVNAFLGVMRGGDVVRRSFAGNVTRFGYVENVITF